jgi:hypothetical protein
MQSSATLPLLIPKYYNNPLSTLTLPFSDFDFPVDNQPHPTVFLSLPEHNLIAGVFPFPEHTGTAHHLIVESVGVLVQEEGSLEKPDFAVGDRLELF